MNLARKHFKGTRIEKVDVNEEYDHEGRKILRVVILYSSEKGPIDRFLRVNFRHQLIPKLM